MFNNKKAADLNISNTNISTLIGEGCSIEGNISAKDSIKIDGEIQGNLNIEGSVIIGEKSHVQGDVRCADLVVFGRLDGNIHARQLQLKQSAQIYGNIEAHILQVEPGAVYQGTVAMQAPSTNVKSA